MSAVQPQELKRLFAHSLELLSQGKVEEWVGLFADDGVLEFPYPAPGFPTTMRGRDELLAQMRMFAEQLRADFSEPEFYAVTDDGLLVAAYTADCTLVATGGRYRQTYLSVVRFDNGRITLFRDFWNPWLVMEAAGGEVAWKQAIQALAGR
ncbi:nuclear transport factor 2 family protein [Streptomyces barkulensis]|uniref:nuclear transport factor 2 family protein n=1 Tax=Streptomyces barkulensis TaxID=1257026 RepID=UPI000C6E5A60|nr:nuclear transport factor 2 family protein [Streptomyces barkulensis]